MHPGYFVLQMQLTILDKICSFSCLKHSHYLVSSDSRQHQEVGAY